jgi:hypothetical protein
VTVIFLSATFGVPSQTGTPTLILHQKIWDTCLNQLGTRWVVLPEGIVSNPPILGMRLRFTGTSAGFCEADWTGYIKSL